MLKKAQHNFLARQQKYLNLCKGTPEPFWRSHFGIFLYILKQQILQKILNFATLQKKLTQQFFSLNERGSPIKYSWNDVWKRAWRGAKEKLLCFFIVWDESISKKLFWFRKRREDDEWREENECECMSRRKLYHNKRSAWRITLFMKFDDI